MYGTTKFFLEHFGLQDLSQLPPLREFKELGEAEQALLPIEETTIVGDLDPAEMERSAEADSSILFGAAEGETVLIAETENALTGVPVEQA